MRTKLRAVPSSALYLLLLVSGCSLVADFDRSKIKGGGTDSGTDAEVTMDGSKPPPDTGAPDAAMDTAVVLDTGVDTGTDDDSGMDDAGVECSTPADCTNVVTACETRTCDDGACGAVNIAAGTALATQTAGDCKRAECDGNGGTQTVDDDTDLPDDSLDCTTDLCNAGSPSHGDEAIDTSCNDNGGKVCDGSGACVECTAAPQCGTDNACRTFSCTGNVCGSSDANDGTACAFGGGSVCFAGDCVQCNAPSDCGTDTVCQTFSCDGHACATNNVADNTAITDPTDGDCKTNACNGSGGIKQVNDDTDVHVDGIDCTDDVCSGGNFSHPNAAVNTGCNDGGGSVCDGGGNCVGCTSNAQCGTDTDCRSFTCNGGGQCITTDANSGDACNGGGIKCDGGGNCVACLANADCGTDTVCQTFTCTGGNTCQTNNVADNTPITDATDGDCKVDACDGAGGTKLIIDDTDVPVDGFDCTNDVCSGGTPSNPDATADTVCDDNGGAVCDGSGNCVECNSNAQCGTDTECRTFTCDGSNQCQTNDVADDTPITDPTDGDCQTLACNGSGGTKAINDDTDVPPTDNKECTVEECITGNPANTPKTSGDACTEGGGAVCDGSGNCVECVVDAGCTSDICIDEVCEDPGALTSVDFAPASLAAGAVGQVTVQFQLQNKWPADGRLAVVFPSGFDLAGAGVVSLTGADGTVVPGVGGQTISFTRSTSPTTTPAGTLVTLVLGGIKNPTVSGTTGTISVTTQTGGMTTIDSGVSPAGVAIATGALTSVGALLGDSTASAVTTATIAFNIANPWPADGSVDVTFPAGFVVSGATLDSTAGADGTFSLNVNGQVVSIVRNDDGANTGASASINIVIDNVVNPAATGPAGGALITTRTFSGAAIDAGGAALPDIT